jgi:hypothetical protein
MYIDLNVTTTTDDAPFLNVTAGSSADFLNNPIANYMMSQERHLKKSDDLVVDFTVFVNGCGNDESAIDRGGSQT